MSAVPHRDAPPACAVAEVLPDLFPAARRRSRLAAALRRHGLLVAGGGLLALVLGVALLAPWLGTVDPTQLAPMRRLRPPSGDAWFGTDMLGRDVYSRTLYGARVSLEVGFLVAALSAALGTLIGTASAAARWADFAAMRVMDGLMAIPSVLLAIALTSLTRDSVGVVVAAITLAETPRVARLVRGLVLGLREQPYVEAAVTCGTPPALIAARHMLPNILGPLSVQATSVCASAMITEAVLSFIGAGTPPIYPSWGNIMAEARALWQVKPHLVFVPAAFLSVTVLSVQLLGDGLRDALDPRAARTS